MASVPGNVVCKFSPAGTSSSTSQVKYSGSFCSAIGCSHSAGRDKALGLKRSYYRFPLADKGRLRSWMSRIPRKNWTPTKYSRICSDHFVGGVKTDTVGSPGYLPTLFLGGTGGLSPKKRTTRSAMKAASAHCESLSSRGKKKYSKSGSQAVAASKGRPAKLTSGSKEIADEEIDHDYIETRSMQGPMTEVEYLKEKLKENESLCTKTMQRTLMLESMTEEDFPLFTGLPNRKVFDALSNHLQRRGYAKVTLWRGSKAMASQQVGVFNNRRKFPGLKVVLDCTEVWIEQASDLQARKELYSNYKGRETTKFLAPGLVVNGSVKEF
ncbi:hypothetical protein Bbelb_272190 [Branchiostoma belcheri]|nr:hypothetical protein Bbelb_272190 [Branchiostoma belcheri]